MASDRKLRAALSRLASETSALREPKNMAHSSPDESKAAAKKAFIRASDALLVHPRSEVREALTQIAKGIDAGAEKGTLLAIIDVQGGRDSMDFARAELRASVSCFIESLAPREGARSAIEGAVKGSYSENATTSAMGGQVVVGFIPIVGQLADLRDLLKALSDLADHKEGAIIGVAAGVVGFIPGLDFLKAGGTVAGRAALRDAAEHIDDVALSGLKVLERKLGPATAEQLEKQVRVINVMRTELGARLDAVMLHLPQNERGLAKKLRNALHDHATPADVVGAMRDVNGLPVAKGAKKMFDHFKEVGDALNSTKALLEALDSVRPAQRRLLEGALNDCKKLLERVTTP